MLLIRQGCWDFLDNDNRFPVDHSCRRVVELASGGWPSDTTGIEISGQPRPLFIVVIPTNFITTAVKYYPSSPSIDKVVWYLHVCVRERPKCSNVAIYRKVKPAISTTRTMARSERLQTTGYCLSARMLARSLRE